MKNTVIDQSLAEVVRQFCRQYPDCEINRLGCGNINDTYLVSSSTGKFVLQRISTAVFPEPLHIITNFQIISAHLEKKTTLVDSDWKFSQVVHTISGELFCRDNSGGYWRAQTYLPHHPLSQLCSNEQALELGKSLGLFHLLVADMDCQYLHDPLPGFHILPTYFKLFDQARKKHSYCAGDSDYCHNIIEKYREKAGFFEEAKKKGIVKMQPIHGDPKIDNFIFDKAGLCLGLIDMDTAGLGLIHIDLGDCLRSCCNREGENNQAGGKINFDMGICRGILAGYYLRAGRLLSPSERLYIYDAVLLVTFELGLRFFTDHLMGNHYFHVESAGENLQRALNQFRLVEEIEKCEQEIRGFAEI